MSELNRELYNRASEAINKLFNDTPVSKERAIENLEALIEEITILIESLEN
jgi:hypothetical protein